MKIYIPILFSVFCSTQLMAQENLEPLVLPELFSQKVSSSGQFVMAQDLAGSAVVYDLESKKDFYYEGYYPGNGNCVADNGILVGQDMITSRGAIMNNGEVILLSSAGPIQGSLDAITPDGTRACGWLQNTKAGPLSIPVYIDIDADGKPGKIQALPFPAKDFFNDTPQFCNATCISDDGKTIAGIVLDGSGFYSYPIVYSQNEAGDWSYDCPSKAAFNPDNLEIPEFPDLENLDVPDAPVITDYMSDEMKVRWEQQMAEYETSGDPSLNPWSDVTSFTGEEGYAEYEKAITVYNKEVNEIMDKVLDEYWLQMEKIGKNQRFIPNMALSPNGEVLYCALGVQNDEFPELDSSAYVGYKFYLSDGTFTTIDSQYLDLIPAQILNNGTLVAIASPNGKLAYNSYVFLPEEVDFITFIEYMKTTNPGYDSWLTETLPVQGSNLISGYVAFSSDMSVIASGVPYDDFYSYVITSAEASVEGIPVDFSDVYNVYNLSGIKVLTTKDASLLKNLPNGIYIINGKKVKL